jgi:Carboxypeptidase regulatory-like domain
LIGGTGVITGTVTGADGKPLGGVTVMVARGTFTAATATLTTGTPGAYTATDIPTPGTYTVTFSQPGFLDETRQVVFTGPGSQSGVDVAMRPSDATISGTVTSGGAGLGGASVELSDGKNIRTTSTATSPAGSFTFAHVVAGTYTVKVSRKNFQTQVVLVHVNPGDAPTETIDMPAA